MEGGRAGRRTDKRAHVEGQGTILHEDTRRVRQRQREQFTRGAVLTEDRAGEAGDDRGRTAGRQGIDGRRRGDRRQRVDGGIEGVAHRVDELGGLGGGQRAAEAVHRITREEARARTGERFVHQDVATDGLGGGTIRAAALETREVQVCDDEVSITSAADGAEAREDERPGGLHDVHSDRTRRRGVGAQNEGRGILDSEDGSAGRNTCTEDLHARDESLRAGQPREIGRSVGRGRAE